jgi:hypothetical protein
MATAKVVAPMLETLVEGTGAAPLHDVSFRGLTFADATWLAPNEGSGFVHIFASSMFNGGDVSVTLSDWPTLEEQVTMPGKVVFRSADRIVLEDNVFTRLGAVAVELSKSSSGNVLRGNVIGDVSGGGVEVGVMPPDATGSNRGNVIENNWIHDVGVEYRGSVPMFLLHTDDTVVAHNQVNGAPYSGILFAPTSHGGQIVDNLVFDTMKVLRGGGGIYLAGAMGTTWEDGAVVTGNVVPDTYTVGNT